VQDFLMGFQRWDSSGGIAMRTLKKTGLLLDCVVEIIRKKNKKGSLNTAQSMKGIGLGQLFEHPVAA
jgi:hypothetical protein